MGGWGGKEGARCEGLSVVTCPSLPEDGKSAAQGPATGSDGGPSCS